MFCIGSYKHNVGKTKYNSSVEGQPNIYEYD